MNPALIGALVMAGMGALKGHEDKQRAGKARHVEATRQLWSPWTGDRGRTIQEPSSLGPIMQGAMAGAMLGSQFKGGGGSSAKSMDPEAFAKMDKAQQQGSWFNPYGAGGGSSQGGYDSTSMFA